MSCIDEDKEVEIFIQKYGIVPTSDEKMLLTLAILHGAMVYNRYEMRKILGEDHGS